MPATKLRALSKAGVRLSVRLFVCPMPLPQKRCVSAIIGLQDGIALMCPVHFRHFRWPYGHIATAVLTDDIHSNYVGFLSVFYSNHSSTMHRFQLGAWNRQTNGRADGWQHCLKPIGEGIIRRRWCWSSYYLQTMSHYLENTSYL